MAPMEAVTFGGKNMLTTVESISKSIKDSVPLQDINRYDCLTSYNAVACTRNMVLCVLSTCTAALCVFKVIRLHMQRSPAYHHYAIFYIATVSCMIGGVNWVLGGLVQLHILLQFLKLLQFLVLSHYYWVLASRALRCEAAVKKIMYPALLFVVIYYVVTVSLGMFNVRSGANQCLEPYWLLMSAVEVVLVQLFVLAAIYITRRLNEISTLDSVRWAQKRDLWCIVVVFEFSAIFTFIFDVTVQIVGDKGDFETFDQIQQREEICPFGQEVSKCQCRVTKSTDIFDCYTYNRSQVDVLFQPCTKFGIICLNSQQPGGLQCQDYELRFLCTDVPRDSPSSSPYLLSFDLKVYIILAAVPLLIFALRILWSCARRCQRKPQQRHRRESNVSDSTTSSSYNEDEAFTSSLATPPPAYSDLFGQSPPQVFAISNGIVGGCSLCRPRGTAQVDLENPRPTSRADDAQRVNYHPGDAGYEVSAGPAPGDSAQSSESLRTTLENVADNTPTVVASRPDVAAATEERNALQLDFCHFGCACPCHNFQFITSGQVNPAFTTDSAYGCEPKLGPGMHKPVFSFLRVNTSASSLSVTDSLPDYEQALELLSEGSQHSPLRAERRQMN